jgi:uncharacterized protein
MRNLLRKIAAACLVLATVSAASAAPLRVFIRAGVKTHGPNQHDHPRFLEEYTKLLNERGAAASGALNFPSAEQLDQTDVLVVFAADGMKAEGDERARFEKFLRRGGGLVVVHDGVVAGDKVEDQDWAKMVQGGVWRWQGENKTTWHEGDVGLYFIEPSNPITRDVSNFDWKDEVYNRLDMAPDAHVIATSFIDVFNIWPQMWTYEKTWDGGSSPYRAFVSIPGHEYTSFQTPQYRTLLLRGIAWAGKRADVDELCSKSDIASLRYPPGGPTPAPEAVKHFNLHPEFNISLTADENVARKIMSIDWDPQGRLWVVETPEYPGGRDINQNDGPIKAWRADKPADFARGGKEARTPQDAISILEDTNGDGVMDKKTVFAGGLELPTSLVFYKDGVIVSRAPDILWIRDTDGDGKADKTEVLYTGWGTFDTHAVINNLVWGHDGWVYGTVGYTRGKVYSGDKKKFFGDIAAGVYRFRPDGSALEQVAAGGCNTWGVDVAPDNEIFFSTATCGEPINHVVIPEPILARGNAGGMKAYLNIMEENKIYPPFQETRQPYVQIDWVGAWTAAAGATIYNGGAWPAKWEPDNGDYSFFMSETTMHIYHHEYLSPSGPTYRGHKEEGRKETHFLTSNDYWFRPIHSRVGPDGAMYVVDFYNQIAVHNDTRGPAHGARNAATRPDRDHHFTRIYRVQHKDAKPLPPWKFDLKDPAGLAQMLRHPNGWVRSTANRLFTENPDLIAAAGEDIVRLVMDHDASPFARIEALWLYRALAQTQPVAFNEDAYNDLAQDPSPVVRKNLLRVAAEMAEQGTVKYQDLNDPELPKRTTEHVFIERLRDANDRVKIDALIGVGSLPPTRALADAVVAAWPGLKDRWLQSAAVGASARDPLLFLEAAFGAKDPAFLADYVPHLARLVANKNDAALAAKFVSVVAGQPAAVDGLKAAAVGGLVASLPNGMKPPLDAGLVSSLKALLGGAQTAAATLPLIARWDAGAETAAEVKPAVARAVARLADTSATDEERGRLAASLVGVRKVDDSIIPAVAALLGGDAPEGLQKRVVDALGADPEGGLALVKAFPKLSPELAEPAFGQILKRSESASAFIDLLEGKAISPRALGPVRVHRLRTLGDAALAKRANTVIDGLAGPEEKAKDDLIAKLTPDVVKPGNLENGRKLFTQNCAPCHIFKNEGRNLAPNLTGMGAHGPADLLVHIVDPNRQVEPNFVSVSIETKDGSSYEGIVERENNSELLLRDATGDHAIRKSEIAHRASTGRSLMPEGFESLGGDGLRDILAYICADESRFRILDLSKAFTANSSHGLYYATDHNDETVTFRKYGVLKAGDVPFDVVNPQKAVANVIVLKGGDGFAKTLPKQVEVKVGFAAKRLYILGGVGGWAYPYEGANLKGKPAGTFVVHYAGGATEEIVTHNGDEVADYIAPNDVPGSKGLPDWVSRGQIRWFGKDLKRADVIESITISSDDNQIAPTLFAITAELPGSNGPRADLAPGPAAAPLAVPAGKAMVAITGGNSSHDFQKWWGGADRGYIESLSGFAAAYTENINDLVDWLPKSAVLLLAHNQPTPNPDVRKGIEDFVKAGKGLVVVHAGNWFNWNDWPAYNRTLVSGGAHGHDRYGEFEVELTAITSPITEGLPAKFRLKDELYHIETDANGSERTVLATAKSPVDGKVWPIIWTTKQDKGRVVCITLGHDGAAHNDPNYQRLLANAIHWAAGR